MNRRVIRGKDHCGVKRQSEIFAKTPSTVRITGPVQVARCLNRHLLARGTSLCKGMQSIFN